MTRAPRAFGWPQRPVRRRRKRPPMALGRIGLGLLWLRIERAERFAGRLA